MKRILILIFFAIKISVCWSQTNSIRSYRIPEGVTENQYNPHIIIAKIESPTGFNGQTISIDGLTNILNIESIKRAFPQPSTNSLYRRERLANIYNLKISSETDIEEAINTLLEYENVIYAEPCYHYSPLFTPNDPEANETTGEQRDYLEVIKAYDAWDLEKGDTSVTIGIIDTGTDLNHEDLDNIKYNYADPINGDDDDDDGFVDNYMGWDFGNNDNNPTHAINPHGVEVAGYSSASTDNGIGIAGVGYQCKYVPIKVYSDNMATFWGYEGIIYAAERGIDVINLSWGNTFAPQQLLQDVIDYAVIDRDAIVVAAAGNTDAELDFYPASYQNVLSVAKSDVDDTKPSSASWSTYVDLVAPGQSVYTTKPGSGYGPGTGSSFSTPIVAGAAGLVRSHFPTWTAPQVMEQLRVTTDDIYDVPGNDVYHEMLGKGRLNIHKALTETFHPAIRMVDYAVSNSVDDYAFYGDTIVLNLDLVNYLNAASSVLVKVSISSPFVTLIDSVFFIDDIGTMDTINSNESFRVYLHEDIPNLETLKFRIGFEAENYNDFQYFEFKVNPHFLNIDNGKMTFTTSSNGNLGYADDIFVNGVGINMEDTFQLARTIGVIFTSSDFKVSNNVPTNIGVGARDQDFDVENGIRLYTNSTADIDARSVFNDNSSVTEQFIKVEHKVLGWLDEAYNDFYIIEYRVTNTGVDDLPHFAGGIYADWNFYDWVKNKTDWYDSLNLGYVYNNDVDSVFAGTALLTDQDPTYYGLDNITANGNVMDFDFTFTKTNKYDFLHNGTLEIHAGVVGNGNDVSNLTGFSIDTLRSMESVKVAFAVLGARSLDSMKLAVLQAKDIYQEYIQNPPILDIVGSCPNIPVDIDLGGTYEFYEQLEDTVPVYIGDIFTVLPSEDTTTYYVVNVDNTYDGDVERILVVTDQNLATFDMSTDTLVLDGGTSNLVFFSDLSNNNISWNWNFDNGFTSNISSPQMLFTEPGSYDISLAVETDIGCMDTINQTLQVLWQGSEPIVSDETICSGDNHTIQAPNASTIRVYSDLSLTSLIHEGSQFTLTGLTKDTIVYITNADSIIESSAKRVEVNVISTLPIFEYMIDTTNLAIQNQLVFSAGNLNVDSYKWYINGAQVNQNNNFTYNFGNDNSIRVQYDIVLGSCHMSLSDTIVPQESDIPIINDTVACFGGYVLLQPSNGMIFYFYDDGNNLIHAGHTFNVGPIHDTTLIYIKGIDRLLESDVLPVHIFPRSYDADFNLEPQLLNLYTDSIVVISDVSTDDKFRVWHLPQGDTSSEQSYSYVFNDVGNYEIQLITMDDYQCLDTVSKSLLIINDSNYVTGIKYLDEDYIISPNPADQYLKITWNSNITENTLIQLFDLYGEAITPEINQLENGFLVQTEELVSGIYIVRMVVNDHTYKDIFIVNH